jgi:tetratricopeptide (TPR) repeat protein
MRVAVYTICKNEQKFVSRFLHTCQEADAVYVTDTGSTDDTVKLLREGGAIVHEITVDPWRFDLARNVSMNVVPEDFDVIVCIDLDEMLTPGWRAALERSWTPETTRMRYKYTWNMLADGTEGVTFWYEKITSRHGYRWVKPVHEILQPAIPEVETYCDGFKLYHYPDSSKSRGSYLGLLELGCREEPNDDRNCHYLGREYMYYGMYEKAIAELQRHLSLPTARWNAERAASMRYLGRCYVNLGKRDEATAWFKLATETAPETREPWVELGNHLYKDRVWDQSLYAMERALAIKEKPVLYICDPESWGYVPHDIAALCSFELRNLDKSLEYAKAALALNPTDQRLIDNVKYIQDHINRR